MKNRIICLLCLMSFVFSSNGQGIETFSLDVTKLNKIRSISKSDTRIQAAKNDLIQKSNDILRKGKKYSVTYNLPSVAFSNKNDYTSRSRYWWPNPNTKDSLPYVLIDGKVNRYSEKVSDKPMIDGLAKDIIHLGLAYFYTKDERYVKWSCALLECFFVNDKTKMNPNFNFSQVIPGKNDSGGSIMESVVLIDVIEGIQLMKSSANFPFKLETKLNQWFSNYLFWLNNDSVGKKNATYSNNRGTYYTLLRCDIAMFLGNRELAKKIFVNEAFRRVDEQISDKGIMEKEISRTLPLGYVKYNLSGFLQLSEIGRKLSYDLVNYTGPEGQSLKKALVWLSSFKNKNNVWQYSSETGITTPRRLMMRQEEETNVRFTVERFDNYLEYLTDIK